MSRWHSELLLNLRYAIAGSLNALLGLGCIILLSFLNFDPLLTNLAGYSLAITVGFLVHRGFVFRSVDKLANEALRYWQSFLFSYSANLLVLYISLEHLKLSPLKAQMTAVSFYVASMYFLSRVYVFQGQKND